MSTYEPKKYQRSVKDHREVASEVEELLERCRKAFTEREIDIVIRIGRGESFGRVAPRWNVTPERIRQIYNKALRKLYYCK